MKRVQIKYFAVLKEERGLDKEAIQTDVTTVQELYEQLKKKHGFRLSVDLLRVSVNNAFVRWDFNLNQDDEIVFIPPVAGG